MHKSVHHKSTIPVVANSEFFEKPSGFNWDYDFHIYKKKNGLYGCDLDWSQFRASGSTKHVNQLSGDDTNSGNTAGSPYKTLLKAQAVGASTILVYPDAVGTRTFYNRTSGPRNTNFAIDTNLICLGNKGDVIFDQGNPASVLTWTDLGGGVFRATRSSVEFVHDIDVNASNKRFNGGAHRLTKIYPKKATLAEVQAQSGCWFTDDTFFYLRTLTGVQPGATIRYRLNESNFRQTSDKNIYFENVTGYGRDPFRFLISDNANNNGYYMFNGCAGYYGDNQPNFAFDNAANVIINNGISEFAINHDGFNYHKMGANTPQVRVLEMNAYSYDSGQTTGTNYNGSTGHDGASVIRMNCYHEKTRGPGVIDVDASESINLNVASINSESDEATGSSNTSFYAGDTTNMFLADCRAKDAYYDIGKDFNASITILGNFSPDSGRTFNV